MHLREYSIKQNVFKHFYCKLASISLKTFLTESSMLSFYAISSEAPHLTSLIDTSFWENKFNLREFNFEGAIFMEKNQRVESLFMLFLNYYAVKILSSHYR